MDSISHPTTARAAVDSEHGLREALPRIREAQERYARYTQEEVDRIFYAAAAAAGRARIPLAELAYRETGMGVLEDKVIKNHYAAEYIYNAYKNTPSCGVIEENEADGVIKIAEPLGVIAALIPTTNPTSTTIFKCLLALKTRNAVFISPHPKAKKSTIAAASLIHEAAVAAGAPEGIIDWIDEPTGELSRALMRAADVILATGGTAMVQAAYSSGKPALGVGAGNTPTILDESADVVAAVSSIIHSKIFDNGMICASEQSVIVLQSIYEAVKAEFAAQGCYFLTPEETERVRGILFSGGSIHPDVVGQSAVRIADMAGVSVAEGTKVLIGEVESVDMSEVFAREKLSPVLAMYCAQDFDRALDMADALVKDGGYGHTAAIYADEVAGAEHLALFAARMKACRILVNTPAAQGGIGDLYNFRLAPSLTLGCGSWGGNSISDNVGISHLLNVKTVAKRRQNMLWFRVPARIYTQRGCLATALEELRCCREVKKAFIVTDAYLYEHGFTKPITDKLQEMGISYTVYGGVQPDPTLAIVKQGAARMREFSPDAVIALGGGSAIDAGKMMWVLYEHPDVDFADMSMRFMDIRKRIYPFPSMGKKAYMVAVPTTSGTGAEVTPFAVITDETTDVKYPIADYALLPDMAIVDPTLHQSAPPALTAAAGLDALTHAIEAYVSMMATDYTDALALQAVELIFAHLPAAYDGGEKNLQAREKMASAATIAGMAFGNAFLGLCHAMAHQLGALCHLPHGIANALLIEEVMRYNAAEVPTRMGTFPQYEHPHARARYARIAQQLGIRGRDEAESLENLMASIGELKARVGIRPCIRDYDVEEKTFLSCLDDMVTRAFDDQCVGANPRYPMLHEIREIYLRAYYGAAGK